jgi:hypothetical protein
MNRNTSFMMRGFAASLALCLGAAGAVEAQNQGQTERLPPEQGVTRVGTRGANFLEIPVGARATALGGAGAVIIDGVHGLHWNPAAAGEIESLTGAFTYMEAYSGTGINHVHLGVALPLLGGAVGVTVNSLNSGEIARTHETRPSGEDVTVGGSFEWTASAIALHYGRRITDRLVVGGAIKHIGEGMTAARADWIGADVGVRFVTGLFGTTVGGSIVNIGGASRMSGNMITTQVVRTQEVFPVERNIETVLNTHGASLTTAFQFGVMMDLLGGPQALFTADPRHRAALLFDLRDATDAAMQPVVAMEYGFNEFAFVRFGKHFANEEFANHDFSRGLSAGAGLRVDAFGRRIDLDYGYMNLGVLNDRHVFSFQFAL